MFHIDTVVLKHGAETDRRTDRQTVIVRLESDHKRETEIEIDLEREIERASE